MPGKYFDLDLDIKLGGEQASDITVASQKAVKKYVDDKVSAIVDTDTLEQLKDTELTQVVDGQVLKYDATIGKWVNSTTGEVNISWGEIQGNLVDQTDLQAVLDVKANRSELDNLATKAQVELKADKTEIPTDFYSKNDVDTKLEKKLDKEEAANTYALKSDIPTEYDHTQILNDIADLKENKQDKGDYVTEEELTAKNYLTAVPDEYVTETELTQKGYLTSASLDGYAKTTDIPTKITELENNANFITIQDVEAKNYLVAADIAGKADKDNVYTKTEIDGKLTGAFHYKGNVTTADDLPAQAEQGDVYNNLADGANYAFDGTNWDKLSETLDLSVFYTKTEIDDKDFTTLAEVAQQGYLTNASLDGYAKTEDIPTDFYTQSEVDTKLQAKANANHTQSSNTIKSLTGYVKEATGALTVEDTLNTALSKLETGLESKQAAGDYALKSDLTDLITIEDVEAKNYTTMADVEAKNYLTSIPDEYITETELNGKGYLTEIPTEYITETELTEKGYLVANDIAGKADTTTVNAALDLKADKQYTYTKSEVDDMIADAIAGGEIDLSGYAKTQDVDNKLALKADQATTYTKTEVDDLLDEFITDIPTDYVTEEEIAGMGFATTQQLTDGLATKQPTGDYALKSELPTIPTNVSAFTNDAGYLTEIPSEFITETELEEYGFITDISGKQDNLTSTQLAAVNSGIDADKVTAYDTHVADLEIHVTTADKQTWDAKQNALSTTQLAATNSGITTEKVAIYDAYAAQIDSKATAVNVYTKEEADAKFLTAHQDISHKADVTYVNEQLALKADKATTYTKTEIDGKLTGAFHYKGNVENEAALPETAEQGDVYNNLENGSNYAWSGTAWDKLSETLDLSVFYTKAEIDALLPVKVSELTNDAGYLVQDDIAGKANSEDLSTVATSGSYNDLSDLPDQTSATFREW